MLCLDLDHFKEVNDTLGHGAGDVLLDELAERLKSCVRPEDTVARLGGDEFAIIQVGVNQPLEVSCAEPQVMEVIKAPFQIDGQELYVGVSIGVAFPSKDDDPERCSRTPTSRSIARSRPAAAPCASSKRRWTSSCRRARRSSTTCARRSQG